MEKEYIVDIKLEFSHILQARNKKEAIELAKEYVLEDNNIKLENNEIVAVRLS